MTHSRHIPGGLTAQAYAEARQNFQQFVANPINHPTRHPLYGTKRPGRVTLIQFVFYAWLRGKSAQSASHDATHSERYRQALDTLSAIGSEKRLSAADELVRAFGLDLETIRAVIQDAKTLG